LEGTASSDPDGIMSNWLWTKIWGPAFLNMNATVQDNSRWFTAIDEEYLNMICLNGHVDN
jgi:hypothetical protein